MVVVFYAFQFFYDFGDGTESGIVAFAFVEFSVSSCRAKGAAKRASSAKHCFVPLVFIDILYILVNFSVGRRKNVQVA